MTTSLKRELRTLLRKAPNEQVLDRIRLAESLLDQFNSIQDLQSKIDHYVAILCDSIKIKDVELSTLALQSLKSFIESEHINAKSLQSITESVTKIEFTSAEPELVEEGYHQAVRVCRAMVKCNASHELTNESISDIIIFCFRVFNSKLVKWLRSKSARTLLSITKTIFKRVHEFPEDRNLKPSYKIRLRLEGTSSKSTFKELADQASAGSNDGSSLSNSSSKIRIVEERHQSYNLAFINDFYCYLASLINPNSESELTKLLEEKICLGLKLLKVAFCESAEAIGERSCLIYTTRNNVCYNIVSILKTVRSIPIISSTLNLASDIFTDLRHHLKYQFEAFLERLIEMLATVSDQSIESTYIGSSHYSNNPTNELRSDVLNTVLELFRNIDHFPYELYYNYDCDPYSSNIYENLVQISSKNCFQQSMETHFTPIQMTSYRCLLSNLSDIHKAEVESDNCLTLSDKQKRMSASKIVACQGSDDNVVRYCKSWDGEKVRARFSLSFRELNETKKRKRLLWLALEKFNARPKDGIQFIKDNKLMDNNDDLVSFLTDNLRVDKKVLGEFLSKEENKPIRESFIRSLDFTGLRIDEALRFMLEKFRLAGESQLIERILDSFSLHWFEQNPGILANSDSALSLAYAIIMLNVDQHSKKVKPMTCDEFDRNLLSPKSERIYDRKLLELIYTSIRDNEIVLPDEQTGAIRQQYLWKCTMVKSDRIDALYWIAAKVGAANMPDSASQANAIYPPTGQDEVRLIESVPIRLPDATVLVINDNCDQQPRLPMDGLPLIEMNKILFEIMWSPTIAALSFIFDKLDTSIHSDLARQIVDQGYIKFALLCASHGHLDNLVVSLCKFTTDLSPISHTSNHAGVQRHHLMTDKNSLAALALLSIIRDYSNFMRDSWANIVRNILQWYCSRCIDNVVQVDDFALQRKLSLKMREIKKSPSTMNQQNSTFLRSVYKYFAGEQPNDEQLQSGRSANGTEQDKANGTNNNINTPSAVQVLIKTIQDAKYCAESMIELMTALTTTSLDGDIEEVEDAEVFKLELFTQIILNNREQALIIWPRIRAYFARQSSICGRSLWLGERIISAAFRIAIQLEPKSESFSLLSHIIATLNSEIVRGDHTFVALMTLTELHAPNVSMSAQELEACFNQVIFSFLDKVLEACNPVQADRTLNRAINLLSKIFLKHHKVLKDLQGFALLWYGILETMDKYIKANSALKEATFELVKNMVLVMDNEQCMSVEMKDITRTKFMFWEFQSGSDY